MSGAHWISGCPPAVGRRSDRDGMFAIKIAIFGAKLCGSLAKIAADGCRLCSGCGAQCAEIPRQQHVDVGVAMAGGERLKSGFHIGERLDAIELAGADERGQTCPVLGSFVVAREKRILSVESQRPDQVLDRVVVHFDPAIVEIDAESFPMVGQVGERLSPKSNMGKALAYLANHWEGLCVYLDDGRVEMGNNPVENLIRPLTLNRKNALFAGHDEGAQNWARLASLIGTCKLNGVEPFAYMKAT